MLVLPVLLQAIALAAIDVRIVPKKSWLNVISDKKPA